MKKRNKNALPFDPFSDLMLNETVCFTDELLLLVFTFEHSVGKFWFIIIIGRWYFIRQFNDGYRKLGDKHKVDADILEDIDLYLFRLVLLKWFGLKVLEFEVILALLLLVLLRLVTNLLVFDKFQV